MNLKRAILTLTALMLLPGMAVAQSEGETIRFDVSKLWVETDLDVWPNPAQEVDYADISLASDATAVIGGIYSLSWLILLSMRKRHFVNTHTLSRLL